MAHGLKTKIIFTLASIIVILVGAVIGFNYFLIAPTLAENMIANDKVNTVEHIAIRDDLADVTREMIKRDEMLMRRDEELTKSQHQLDRTQAITTETLRMIQKKM